MTVRSVTDLQPEASAGAGVEVVLDRAARVVGADRVTRSWDGSGGGPASVLGPNAGLYRARDVHGVVRPRTAEEVQRVVGLFADGGARVPLHVFSTGGNWGLGSREPAGDGAVVLDLSGLDRIRGIDVARGWAVVEPGVSQARLAKLLQGTERMVNVTASSAHTSVVGNALDRGVGLRHQRTEDLTGVEVVLPSGELIRVGWWPEPGWATPVHVHGLGPSLVQLFVQSSLGVVTAATVRLLPRPEALRVVRLNFTPDKVRCATAEVRRWVSQGLTRGVVKMYDETAARAYAGPAGQYLVHVCVDGTAEAVDALSGIIVAEAVRSGLFSAVSDTDATDPAAGNHDGAVRVERAYAGDPDTTDTLFEAKTGLPAGRFDEEGGFLLFLPLVPFTGPALERAHELVGQVRGESGIRCGVTFNALNADVVDCVVTMGFARDAEQAARAHGALERLYELFTAEGFVPYRLDIEHSGWAGRLTPGVGARAFARRLKDAVDPHHVIAAGRYA
ncbi:FAD-binding oxidoreductase [Streptomyces sp. NBC_01314]|uniref:FAD-binding oxidoreductase n=1 Tax=Streptomyces sp. NBC_01314 TaxID=2903821 RepID=UPI003086D049|nr:FAD-binding oxidoreductase [Streptomyces sp. NBC_01314]WRZ54381.1 FAD-binding oxidoreductase [Streptomyces sp. NBC_01314]